MLCEHSHLHHCSLFKTQWNFHLVSYTWFGLYSAPSYPSLTHSSIKHLVSSYHGPGTVLGNYTHQRRRQTRSSSSRSSHSSRGRQKTRVTLISTIYSVFENKYIEKKRSRRGFREFQAQDGPGCRVRMEKTSGEWRSQQSWYQGRSRPGRWKGRANPPGGNVPGLCRKRGSQCAARGSVRGAGRRWGGEVGGRF